jgi:hypothetical protein
MIFPALTAPSSTAKQREAAISSVRNRDRIAGVTLSDGIRIMKFFLSVSWLVPIGFLVVQFMHDRRILEEKK